MRNRIFTSVRILAAAGLTAVAGFAEKQYAGEEIWSYALWFDGEGDYVDLPVHPGEIDDGPITFSCSLLIAPGAGDERMKIFSGYGGTEGENRWDFEYNRQGDDYKLWFNEWGGTGSHPGNRQLEEGVWYFVSFVWEPGEQVTLYVDGEKDASFRIENTTLDDGHNFRIGGRPDGSEKEWEGGIRNVALWSSARSREQIQADMQSSPAEDEEGLSGCWPMNEGEGDVARDRSGNDNHGKIIGAAWAMKANPSTLLAESPEQALPAFIKAAREHHSKVVRKQAVRGLGMAETARGEVESVLLAILEAPEETTQLRLSALESLNKLDADVEEMITALLNILKNTEDTEAVRLAALDALKILNAAPETAAPALLEILKDGDDGEAVRLETLNILLGLDTVKEDLATALLFSLEQAEEPRAVRAAVLLTLKFYRDGLGFSDFAPRELTPALLKILKDAEDAAQARRTAVELFERFDDKLQDLALAPALLQCLKNGENTNGVRRAILEGTGALEITAENIDDEAENPYPETLEEIAAYREYIVSKYHEEICFYPEEVTEISSLEELFEYAGKSGVNVRMEPGLYEIGVDNCDELWEGGNALLLFDGEHSYYDLRGVEIMVDTYLNHTRGFTQELVIAGDNLIIRGLRLTMVGNDYGVMREVGYNWGQTLTHEGNNNLLKEIRVISRGAYPYGYGHALMFDGVAKNKRSAVGAASGENNVFIDWEIYNRSMGHALGTGSGENKTTWIDCLIDGEVRLSDDILKETAGGFYQDMDSLSEEDFNIIKGELRPGRMYPLSEDAFRSYGDGKELRILGGTVREVRSAVFRGHYETLFVSNTRFTRLGGALFGIRPQVDNVKIVNAKVDVTCRQLFRLWGGSGRELELILMPVPSEDVPKFRPGPGRSALLDGEEHKIVLKAGEGLDVEKVKREQRDYPIQVHGTEHVIHNETGLPILLTEDSRNCRVITNGEVTDNGEGNKIEYTD